MDYRRLNSVVDAEAKLREKHQGLLQDYLVLQKDCVSKKRKLKESTERKVTLLDEIRFLKHRRNLLLKKQLRNTPTEQKLEVIQSHKADVKYNAESSRRYMNGGASTSISRQAFQNHKPPMVPTRNSGSSVKEVAAFSPVKLGKKTKNLIMNGKQADKRKITWQDPLALRV